MKRIVMAAAAAGVLAAGAAHAGVYVVPGTSSIWMAGQGPSYTETGYFSGGTPDTGAANPAIAISTAGVAAFGFSATGSTSVDTNCFAGPDGGCYSDESSFSPSPWSGLYKGPSDALVGVFLASGATLDGNGPASLDFTNPANISKTRYTPALDQIFFIGDGLTGTGAGATQAFVVPTNAATLYIAVADSYGSSTGNLGALSVTVSDLPANAGVPEPATWGLMIVGLGLLGVSLRRRHAKAAVTA